MMIKRVLVALDGSGHAQKALELAREMASRFDAELIAVHVIPNNPLSEAERRMAEVEFNAAVAENFDITRFADGRDDPQLMSKHLAEQAAETGRRFRFALGERLVGDATAQAREKGAGKVRTVPREGDPAKEILDLADQRAGRHHRHGPPWAGRPRRAPARQRLAQGDLPRGMRLPDGQVKPLRAPPEAAAGHANTCGRLFSALELMQVEAWSNRNRKRRARVTSQEGRDMALPSLFGSGRGRGELAGRDMWEPLNSLRREMERLFEDFSRDTGWAPAAVSGMITAPRLDVSETETELKIEAELPGVDEKDVEVVLSDGRLTIKGEKKQEKEEKKKDYHLVERSYGSFGRTVGLPFEADPEQVKASFAKGVLTVTVPKPPEVKAKEKKIQIGKS